MNTDTLQSQRMSLMGRLVRLEKSAAVLLLLVVVTVLAAQVIARYVFRAPISWSEEVARLALIWLTFVASGFVTADREHIVVDVIPRRLSARVRGMLDRLAGGCVLITCLLLLIGGFRFVWRVWPVGSPGIGVSMSLWYAAASVGLALMSLHTVMQMLTGPDSELEEPASGAAGRSPQEPGPEIREREVRP